MRIAPRLGSQQFPLIKIALSCLAISMAGCSGLSNYSHLDKKGDAKAKGIRHLGTSPYLIAYTDNAGGVTVDLEYLPDPNKLHSSRPFAFLSKTEGKLVFDNSTLTATEDTSDSTAVPLAVIEAGEEVLKAMMTGGRLAFDAGVGANPKEQAEMPQTVPRIAVFKFVQQPDGWALVGENGPVMKL